MPSESGRSLVVQTSFLGDTVLTTPLLALLGERGPVDIVVTPASAALLANSPAVLETMIYDKRGRDRGVRGFLRLAKRLRGARYDAVYLAQGSVRSGALALAAGIPRRVGFATSAGRRFYTEIVSCPEGEHHASRLLRLGRLPHESVPPASALRPRLYPGAAEHAAVDALLGRAGLTTGAPFVAFAPGSVWATKRWPHYESLAALLGPEVHLVVVGSAADAGLARGIVAAAGGPARAVDATGRLSLLASAELIGRARAIVTNDSAPLHLASAMNTPTIAVFGPTVPEFGFGPLAERATTVGLDGLACRPCDRHGPQRCPLLHWRCMREITAGRIAALVHELEATAPAARSRPPSVAPPSPPSSPLS